MLTGWPTASALDWKDSPGMATEATNPDGSARKRLDQLPRVATLAGWATPVGQQANGTPEAFLRRKVESMERGAQSMGVCLSDLQMQAKAYLGPTQSGTSAETESIAGYRLNPHFSRWLMGYPPEWCDCADTAMQSFPKSRRRSSKHS